MKKRSKFLTPWPGYWFKSKGYDTPEPVLVTPYDEEITVKQIDCIPYNRQLIDALERKVKTLERKIDSHTSIPNNVVAFGPHLRRKEYGIPPKTA